MTNFDFNVSHSNTKDQKLIYEFGKEMNFIIKQNEEKVTEINQLKTY